jgi:hypothetical protein
MNWKKFNVSARNFPIIVMATPSIIEVPLLITLLPIVDRACFRKIFLYIFGTFVFASSSLIFFYCRTFNNYSFMSLLCIILSISLTLYNATIDAYLPLLATSDINVARALTLAPPLPIKKKQRKKKKRKKKKKKDDNDNDKEKPDSAGISKASDDHPFDNSNDDISRKPVPLQQLYTRQQDRLSSRSMYRGVQFAFYSSIFFILWIWW